MYVNVYIVLKHGGGSVCLNVCVCLCVFFCACVFVVIKGERDAAAAAVLFDILSFSLSYFFPLAVGIHNTEGYTETHRIHGKNKQQQAYWPLRDCL